MSRYTGPKNRLSRREGFDLFGKGKKLRRPDVLPGQKKAKGPFARQTLYRDELRARQRIKRFYALTGESFERYINNALQMPGAQGENLLSLLERRLDNVIFRLGFAKTRSAARQLVRHGHVKVNGRTTPAPSYEVSSSQEITLSPQLLKTPVYLELSKNLPLIPAWLERRDSGGIVKRFPKITDVPEPLSPSGVLASHSK